jgi:hypothetical protein
VNNITVWGCTKQTSIHVGTLQTDWDHVALKVDGACQAKYHDQDGDGVCELCRTAADCGPGMFWGGTCTSGTDNSCTACAPPKPAEAKYSVSGTCEFTCLDDRTGARCEIRNPCADTELQLSDVHGDGWNGAIAHIDAYTGPAEWTFLGEPLTGQGTSVNSPTDAQLHWHSIGCRKNGCYSVHFEGLGTFPKEVAIYANDGNSIVAKDALAGTDQKFLFQIQGGQTSAVTQAECDNIASMPYVQINAEPTLAPGTPVDHNRGYEAGTVH